MKGSIDVIADINEVPHEGDKEGDKEAFNVSKITRYETQVLEQWTVILSESSRRRGTEDVDQFEKTLTARTQDLKADLKQRAEHKMRVGMLFLMAAFDFSECEQPSRGCVAGSPRGLPICSHQKIVWRVCSLREDSQSSCSLP